MNWWFPAQKIQFLFSLWFMKFGYEFIFIYIYRYLPIFIFFCHIQNIWIDFNPKRKKNLINFQITVIIKRWRKLKTSARRKKKTNKKRKHQESRERARKRETTFLRLISSLEKRSKLDLGFYESVRTGKCSDFFFCCIYLLVVYFVRCLLHRSFNIIFAYGFLHSENNTNRW